MHSPERLTAAISRLAQQYCVAAFVLCTAGAANGDLIHRYSFTSDGSDSVGGAHGVVVDPGTPTAVFASGQLDLSSNVGEGSNNISDDAYVDLPNGVISAAASGGVNGAITLEWWATASEVRTWSRLGDFGTSDGGEDSSIGGEGSSYIIVTPHSGRVGGDALEATNHPAGGPEPAAQDFMPFGIGIQRHVAVVFDHNDATEGPNGTMSLYRDGVFIDRNDVDPGIDLRTFVDNNNWLGRSQWNDPTFVGSFNEFRIHDNALTPEEVQTSAALGPDVVDPNEVLRITLEVDVMNGRTRLLNNSGEAISFDYYRISSVGNSLNAAAWSSLDQQNYDAADGNDPGDAAGDSQGEGWDVSGGSDQSRLIELRLREEDSTLAVSGTLNLGGAFDPAVFGVGNPGDLEFVFGLPDGQLVAGDVSYVAAGLPGDLNFDDVVDGGDVLAWQRGFGSAYDAADLADIEAHFGNQSGQISSAPEPGAIWLAVAAAAVWPGCVGTKFCEIYSARRQRRGAVDSPNIQGES